MNKLDCQLNVLKVIIHTWKIIHEVMCTNNKVKHLSVVIKGSENLLGNIFRLSANA